MLVQYKHPPLTPSGKLRTDPYELRVDWSVRTRHTSCSGDQIDGIMSAANRINVRYVEGRSCRHVAPTVQVLSFASLVEERLYTVLSSL